MLDPVEVIKPVDICNSLGDLLMKSRSHIVPGNKERFELQATAALNKCIEVMINNIKSYSNGGWNDIKDEWNGLREMAAKSERQLRRKELIQPSSEEDLKATLWWMAERGDIEDMELLHQVRGSQFPGSEEVKHFIDVAAQRIIERTYDPNKELQWFYDWGLEELMNVIKASLGTQLFISKYISPVVENLRAIRDLLEAQFEQQEIKRWLITANPKFGGRSPNEVLLWGEMMRVIEILIRLEEGIHN